jgi:hypothetical protein
MPERENKQEIAEAFLIGLRTRNWDLLRKIMTSDIVWSLPGHSRISGEARGIEAVIERAQIIVSYGLTFHFGLVGEICGSPKRSNGRSKFGMRGPRTWCGIAWLQPLLFVASCLSNWFALSGKRYALREDTSGGDHFSSSRVFP